MTYTCYRRLAGVPEPRYCLRVLTIFMRAFQAPFKHGCSSSLRAGPCISCMRTGAFSACPYGTACPQVEAVLDFLDSVGVRGPDANKVRHFRFRG